MPCQGKAALASALGYKSIERRLVTFGHWLWLFKYNGNLSFLLMQKCNQIASERCILSTTKMYYRSRRQKINSMYLYVL
jgi:hypothetical protein